ncbi:hypothetical protein CVT26_006829 [Gymnopilus dilepis]|uniref:2-(3-amino-3-carboxypropyl)histidine synthase subunit 2 n=1 Tax=Gymnopilus dilepis TaxID=231916 RepID=A0A409VN03_9AGAR|nr:hypothetical protein CVT26_006829 [Gymnopilus dilepis]
MTSSTPTTSFSASGEDAITQSIQVIPDTTADQLPAEEFDAFYEIERTSQEIVKGDYQRVALQFPDELLHDSVPIYRHLKGRIAELDSDSGSTTSRELYVLADTSCCVDEVAAQHVNADLVVHYGYACMTLTSRLPVIYVFGRKEIDVDKCITEFMNVFDQDHPVQDENAEQPKTTLLLRHDVAYTHAADALVNGLRQTLSKYSPPISVTYNPIPSTSQPASSTLKQTSTATTSKSIGHSSDQANQLANQVPPMDAVDSSSSQAEVDFQAFNTILYVGGESLGLTNLLMTNSTCDIYTYNPVTHKALHESTTGRTNKLLMRRYVAVQKAKDSDVFGILVGTLGVASYLPLISHIRRLLARKQKKSYTISVGKLNPAKLANFLEIECFVLVACPENSLIEDKEFLRPIVTPYELEVAMQAEQSWTGRYVLDFERLLANARYDEEQNETKKSKANGTEGGEAGEREDSGAESDPDQPVFSVVTGKYRHAKRYGGKSSDPLVIEGSSSLILRNQDSQLSKLPTDSAAGQFLQQRTYQGLEVRRGMDAPSVLEQGRSGIARGYQDDRSHQDFERSSNASG